MQRLPHDKNECIGKKKDDVQVAGFEFTQSELDIFLSQDAINQELSKMKTKNVLPSQLKLEVKADIVDAIKWQDAKEKELQSKKTAEDSIWVSDILENFVAFGLSPANTKDEAKILLESMDKELQVQESGGFGPDARNYIYKLRRELELLIDSL